MIDMNLLVKLNKDELIEEKSIETDIKEIAQKMDLAIKNYRSVGDMVNEQTDLSEKMKALKGGAIVERGYKLANNSTELAEALIERADRLGKSEDEAFTQRLDEVREEKELIKKQIEKVIDRAKQLGVNKSFGDIDNTIEFWEKAKVDVFTKTGEKLVSAWNYLLGQRFEFTFTKNYIAYLIRQLEIMEEYFLELERKRMDKQSDRIKSACLMVLSSNDDNKVFRQIFLMGQYASNINGIELQLQESKRRRDAAKVARSKSEWARELASILYLDYWIYGKVPTNGDINKQYQSLVSNKASRTISKQMTKQRKMYSLIDKRVIASTKGRKPKV